MTSPGAREPADHRTRPRRRGAVLEAAIFEAVLAELDRSGYARLGMDAIAERAHVSKASLYRRWPGKVALVIASVSAALPDPTLSADTGTLRGDLLATFRDAAVRLSGPAGVALRGIFSDALRDPGRADEIRSHTQGRTVKVIREIVDRAGRRGELDAGAVTHRQLEVGHAMLRQEFLVTGEVSERFVLELVDEVVVPVLRSPRAR